MTTDGGPFSAAQDQQSDPHEGNSVAGAGARFATKVTRRTVIGGLAATFGSPAFAADDGDIELVWNNDQSVLGLRLGGLPEWLLPRAAFAEDAKIEPTRHGSKLQIRIDPVRFAGVPAGSIELLFERREGLGGSRWQFLVATKLFADERSTAVFFSDFLAKGRLPAGTFGIDEAAPDGKDVPYFARSKKSGQSLLDRILGKSFATCEAAARLSFLPDLSWSLEAADAASKQPLIGLATANLIAKSLRFGRAMADRGPCYRAGSGIPAGTHSLAVVFHDVASNLKPIVIGRKGKARGEVSLETAITAAFERIPLSHEGSAAGALREALLVSGAGQFYIRHGQAKSGHRDGPFYFDRGETWWTRRGTSPWEATSALSLTPKEFPWKAAFGTVELRGGPDTDPISLTEKAGKLDIEGFAAITHIGRQVAGSDFSRLDLRGGLVEFELPDTKKKGAKHVVTLGSEGGARIPLDNATLAVTRSKDLVALKYRFQALDLVLNAKSATIALPLPKGDPKATPVESLFLVELPPQHVAEEAIYRVLPEEVRDAKPGEEAPVPGDVVAPNVLVDELALDQELKAKKLPLAEHAKQLAALVEKEKRKDTDYNHFIELVEKELRGGRQPGDPIQPEIKRRVMKLLQAEEANKLPLMTRARLSGPTRVAFQVAPNTDSPKAPAWSAKLDVASLTDFSKLDLKVVRRAMRYEAPEVTDPHSLDNPLSVAKELAFFGVEAFPVDKIRDKDTEPGKEEKRWGERMQNIRSLMQEPAPFETSIELPTLLMLSPDNKAKWRTPRLRNVEHVPYGHVPLWRMQLEQPRENGPQVRAVWSSDFRREVFADGSVNAPERGEEYRRKNNWYRTAMDGYDRHELVALSSLHGLPVLPRLVDDPDKAGGLKLDGGQFMPPEGFAVWPDAEGQNKEAIYRPRPLTVTELSLTAMGGSMTLNSGFEPPTGLRFDASAKARVKNDPRMTFTVERWRQQTVLGRDVVVEVVYKGFLFPIGHRCTLVKLTERKFLRNTQGGYTTAYLVQRMFLRIGKPDKIYPGKYHPDEGRRWPLRGIKVLTQSTPDIVDPTDDVSDPTSTGPGQNGRISRYPLSDGAAGTAYDFQGLVFWPRTGKAKGREILFKLELEGSAAAVEMPLIFVDNKAAHDPATIAALCNYYRSLAKDPKPGPGASTEEQLVQVLHGGVERRYAEEKQRGTTGYETIAWVLGAEGRAPKPESAVNDLFEMDAMMEGADQPPFYPYIRRSQVRIKQLERLSGGAAHPVWARYLDDYRLHGFAATSSTTAAEKQNPAEVFFELLDDAELSFDNSGDRSGGVAKPNVPITALSRSNGPIGTGNKQGGGGGPLKFVNFGSLDPESFFPKAKLLGIVDFKDLLTIAAIASGNRKAMPDIKQMVNYAAQNLVPAEAVRALAKGLKQIELWTDLDGVQSRWKKVQDNFKFYNEGTFKFYEEPGSGPKVTIRDLLPGLASAMDEIHGLMPKFIREMPEAVAADDAKDLVDVDTEREQIIGIEFGKLYEAARRLLTEIELVAEDPVAPLKVEARQLLAELRGSLSEALSNAAIKPLLETAFQAAAVIDGDIEDLFKKWFIGPEGQRWRRNILFLDEPLFGWSAGVPNLATRFITCFAGSLGIAGPIAGYTRDQWGQIVLKFADADNFARYARECFGHMAADLQAYYDSLSLADAALAQLRSWVTSRINNLRTLAGNYTPPAAYQDYVEFVRRCFGVQQRLSGIFLRDPAQAVEGLSSDLNEFFRFYRTAVIRQVESIAQDSLQTACANVAGLLLAFAAVTTPEPPEGALTCAVDPAQSATTGTPAVLRPLVKTCSDIRDVLVSATQFIDALDNIVPPPAGVRAEELDKLKELVAQRKGELREIVQRLVTAVGSAARGINEVLDAWRAFFGSLTPAQAADFQAWVDQKATAVCSSPADLKLNIDRARALALATGISIDQTAAAFAVSLTAMKGVQDGWNGTFTDQAIKAAIESARMELAVQVADVGHHVLELLVQQTSSFTAAAQAETDQFRRGAKQKFEAAASDVISQLGALSDAVKDAADKLDTTLQAWQRELSAAQPLVAAYVKRTTDELKLARDAVVKARTASSASEKLQAYGDAAAHIAKLLDPDSDKMFSTAKQAIDRVRGTFEQGLLEQLYSLTDLGTVLETEVIAVASRLAAPMLNILDGVYGVVDDKRKAIELKVNSVDALRILDKFFFNIHNVLYVNESDTSDQISIDKAKIEELQVKAAAGTALTADDADAIITIVAPGTSSLVVLFNQIQSASETVLRLDLARFIDFAEIRKTVENEIKALVPANVSLSYNYSTAFAPHGSLQELFDLWNYADGMAKFREAAGEVGENDNFVIKAEAHLNILTGDRSVKVEGHFQPFQIKLFTKAFDVVTLFFDGASFKSLNGGKPDFKTHLVESKLGPEVEFLKQLEAWLCGGQGNGFFLRLTTQPMFGLEAGYRFGLPIISIGTVSFINVGLEASVMLPFEPGDAIFHVALSSRDNPFIISAAPYGGGGHVGLYANAKTIVGVEASFEFGGVAAFAFGPLSGVGRITTGVFLAKSASRGATIQGHFFAGGSAHIWIFGMSTSLTVRMGQANGGSMCGSAVFSYSFSYGLDDIEFHVAVARQEGKGFSGSGSSSDNSDGSGRTRYAQLTANDAGPQVPAVPPMPPLKLDDKATPAERAQWLQKWDDWKKASRKNIRQHRDQQDQAKVDRLNRIAPYGVKITSKVATREHAWRSYKKYFDRKMLPED
ncbi:hypothetical protein GGD65_005405 [Bradyrhizobium sp. CIR18]|uniref:hypothetical protein n=1 Tax=Bradyrhizobium sp. CIR18 TaxID=2663839 RepID=UPI001606BED3|nr:hypothetical protein [Bradyrhizobium sp. CIR18]MBB4364347.1 hypothetical protein [Bradyrhizobium sp. CIR18]